MKRIVLIIIFPLLTIFVSGQNKEQAQKLVDEGIALHDKGDFEAAIAKYNSALEVDKDNLTALAEKALTLMSLNKFEETLAVCKKAIEKHPGEDDLKGVYVAYGNALDALKKTSKAIEVYDDGIKAFPGYYQLYFNKGVSLSGNNKTDDALPCFEKSVSLNSMHASSNNAISRLLYIQGKSIPSLLAMCRFLILEPQGDRAKENLEFLQKLISSKVKKTGEKSVTITLDSKMLETVNGKGKTSENNFAATELILSMDAALDYDEKNVNKTEVEKFTRKITGICSSLKESKNRNSGFYWEYYAPYFIEMKEKDLIDTFGYIAFASSESSDVLAWLKANKNKVDSFYEWDKNYVFHDR